MILASWIWTAVSASVLILVWLRIGFHQPLGERRVLSVFGWFLLVAGVGGSAWWWGLRLSLQAVTGTDGASLVGAGGVSATEAAASAATGTATGAPTGAGASVALATSVVLPQLLLLAMIVGREVWRLHVAAYEAERRYALQAALTTRVQDLELYLRILEFNVRQGGEPALPAELREELRAMGRHVPEPFRAEARADSNRATSTRIATATSREARSSARPADLPPAGPSDGSSSES